MIDRYRWTRIGALSLFLTSVALAISAWLFSARHAIPLPMSDAWDFIDVFLRPVDERGLGWADLFVQRGGVDHSQPLQKLALYAHWRWFDLDFRVEAMIGQVFSAIAFALLAAVLIRGNGNELRTPSSPSGPLVIGMAFLAIAVALFSLNSTEPLTWSLVSLGWMYISASLAAWCIWLAPWQGRVWGAVSALAAFLLVLAFDEAGLVSAVAGILAKLATVASGPRRVLSGAVLLAFGSLVGRQLLNLISPAVHGASPSVWASLEAAVHDGTWIALLEAPLLGGWVHQAHWAHFGFEDWNVLRGVMLAAFLLLHVCFWLYVLRRLFAGPVVGFRAAFAVALMLFVYGCWAGVVIARAPDNGVIYLWQPRYLMFFQLQWASFALLWVDALLGVSVPSAREKKVQWLGAAVLVLLIAPQPVLQKQTWNSGPFVDSYAQNMAASMRRLVEIPAGPSPVDCPAMLTPCGKAVSDRDRLIGFLVDRELSLFSDRFVRRHPEFGVSGRCMFKLRDWGPREIVAGQNFNSQPDGKSAFWVTFDESSQSDIQLFVDDLEVGFQRGDGLITFLSDERIEMELGADGQLEFSFRCAGTEVAAATVLVK